MMLRFSRPRKLDTASRHLDPYYAWSKASRFTHLGRKEWFHLLLGFETPERARRFAKAFPRKRGRKRSRPLPLFVPSVYARPPAGLEQTRFCTAVVHVEMLEKLNSGWSTRRGITSLRLGAPIEWSESRIDAPDLRRAPRSIAGAKRRTVVTGVIDDGLAIAHERFRRGLGTRIEFFWDQVEPNSSPIPNWDYGYELRKNDVGPRLGIDSLLARCRHGGLVDEEQFYRMAGMLNFLDAAHKPTAQRRSHGTHVMDLACGEDAAGAPSDRPIVCVQLPVRTTEDTSGATLAPQVLDALWYIAERAGSLPLVVNLSYGLFAGPHDGTLNVELALDEFVAERSKKAATAVVVPAGNSHLSRGHACFCLDDGETRALHWRLQPDDRTESLLEIWLPPAAGSQPPPQVVVQIVAPNGQASGPVSPWYSTDIRVSATVVGKLTNYAPAQTGNNRGLIYVGLAATASLDGGVQVAPAGLWQVRITNVGSTPIHDIHGWIQRDDAPFGYPLRGRQSRFEDASSMRFDVHGREIERDEDDNGAAYLQRDGSINAIATGGRTIVIGGFRRSDGHPMKYSAGGPVVDPARGAPNPVGPEAMAVSEDSVACRGVLAAGSRSGSAVAINGTSVAAPVIARWLADEMAARRPGNRQAVFDEVRSQEQGPPRWAEAPPPPKRGGGGRFLPPPHRVPIPVSRRVGER